MNDFTFTNKAYDLLLSLKEEGIINPKLRFGSVQELRLAVDIVKEIYPLYSEADDKTISDFIKDTFNVIPQPLELAKANRKEEDLYRPIKVNEINPGARLKIVDSIGTYFHTFWQYDDTKRIIPLEETTLEAYDRAWRSIWEKAKQGKVFIKNTFAHRIDDIVYHKDDPNSIGIIKGRRMTEDFKNQYTIFWRQTTIFPFKQWDDEKDIINKTKLEAMPMKTNEIVKDTGSRKYNVIVQYKQYSPKEWIAENIIDGSGNIKKIYESIQNNYEELLKQFDTSKTNFGWVEKERNLIVDKHKNIERVIQDDYKIRKDLGYKDIFILNTKLIETKGVYPKKKQIPQTKKKQVTHIDRLVCVEHLPTGLVERMPQSEATELVSMNKNYEFVSKHRWRRCRTIKSVNANRNGLKDSKPAKPEPKLSSMGMQAMKNPTTGELEYFPLGRHGRRSDKHKSTKGSMLVKEQFVAKVIPEEIDNIKVTDSTWEEPWANKVIKIVRPAHVVLKRILTRIQPHKEIKVTEDVLAQRAERSFIDKQKYLQTKNLKSLPELVEEFATMERRGEHFSTVEKWSTSFDKIYTLITNGIGELQEGIYRQLKKKAQRILIDDIIKTQHNFKWADDKIDRFLRYLRLTTHGIFGEKISKPKKVKQIVEFETLKTITRLDHSKLKQQLPKDNAVVLIKFNTPEGEVEKNATFKDGDMYSATGDLICKIRDVIAWKYKKDKEFKDTIIDEGGGIREIGIKFRRKQNEELQKFFSTYKAKYKHKQFKKRQLQQGISNGIKQQNRPNKHV